MMRQETTHHADNAQARTKKSGARYLPAISRVLMGLLFAVMGLNGFLYFLPAGPMPEGATAFSIALVNTGYMMPLTMGTQVLVGALLLANRFVPLALALIAPVVVNILAFHLLLAPAGTPIAVLVVVLEVYLAWTYRQAYRPMLALRADRSAPVAVGETQPHPSVLAATAR